MRTYLAAAAALTLQLSAAHAETIVALIGDDVLATINTSSGKTTGLTKIEGVGPILGIDVRPSDGQLYALSSDGTVATIDTKSGQATPKSQLDKLPPADALVSVDFNPVADKMRIIASDGTNLRANVDDGKVTEDKVLSFAEADAAAGQAPTVIAAAYTNAVNGAKETTLYDIDLELGGVFRQAPPNDGILNTVGMLGIDAGSVSFDIATDASGNSMGWLLAKGNLYALDLTSGKAISGKKIAGLPSDVRDIAVLPAAAVKAASADITMTSGRMMMPKADMTASYLPKPTGGRTGAAQKPMSRMSMSAGGKPVYRTTYGMQRIAYYGPMARRGMSCNRKAAPQY
jgi:DNA-binding beta-propeller fold protein YncE